VSAWIVFSVTRLWTRIVRSILIGHTTVQWAWGLRLVQWTRRDTASKLPECGEVLWVLRGSVAHVTCSTNVSMFLSLITTESTEPVFTLAAVMDATFPPGPSHPSPSSPWPQFYCCCSGLIHRTVLGSPACWWLYNDWDYFKFIILVFIFIQKSIIVDLIECWRLGKISKIPWILKNFV